ncbi:MAG: molecular chaperone HtpG [Bacilli bacterium]|nr:molecular chaperone HtpG [Bacilli bacterium]MBR1936465.1 molecular chaperone HtpG [Bacilli bacterium]
MAKKQFKSESKRLLDLMINSIYTNKDIFLRELISNASDAIDKLYYRSLTDKKLKVKKDKLEIFIEFDKDARTLTIRDNGCGMTKEELENNLGTIAKSGSLEFKENMTNEEKSSIIGQFGVGFYSSFMVSDNIKVTSLSADSDKAYCFESSGVDGYTIEEATKKEIGTEILLHIKEDSDEFNYSKYLDEYELKTLVKKYSDYISYPIKMEVTHHELVDSEKHEYKDTKEVEILNSMVPIWKKKKSDIKEEDYNNFYMDKFNDYDKPLEVINYKVEGMTSYNALLFIPSHAPSDYYTQDYEKGLALYSNGVMIMEKCSDLLPDYFSFIKGIVDSEDLSLNISRELLQESQSLNVIEKNIESKIRKELENMMKNDRDKYISFFKTFGVQLKYGVYNNFGMDKDKLKDLVMFYSSKHEKLISLAEYVSSMKDDQKEIYYASGSSISKIDSMPQVEQVKDKEFDILYLTDYVDEFCITALQEYEGKKFKNVSDGDLDLESDTEKEEIKKTNEDYSDLLKMMNDEIKEVSEVRFSNKLKTHPVCLTTKGDVSIEMQKVFDAMPNDMGIKAEKVLEINEKHPISEKLKKLYKKDKDEFKKYTKILYSEALMIAGLPIEDPAEVSKLICEVLSK